MTSGVPTSVRIAGGSGRIDVVAATGTSFRVEGRAEVVHTDGLATVRASSGKVSVFVDAGTDLVIGTTSGGIAVMGPVGHLAVVTQSGRVDVERAASIDIRNESGRIEVGDVAGTCRIRSSTGRVEVDSCCDADISGDSGRIEVRAVNGEAAAHSVSGRIELAMAAANDVFAETVTGRIDVTLPAGTVAYQPDDPADAGERPPDCDCTVVARSTSGEVVVTAR
jgi:DUF4097 and DUF4098 domain-containing protein YvlB